MNMNRKCRNVTILAVTLIPKVNGVTLVPPLNSLSKPYMIPGVGGGRVGEGCLGFTPHLKKSWALTLPPPLNFFKPKMGKFGQKIAFFWNFLANPRDFWPGSWMIQTFPRWSANPLVISALDPRFQPSDNLASNSLPFEVYKNNTYRYQYPNDLGSFWIKFEPDLLWGPTRERRRWWPSGLRWFRATERPVTCRCRSASKRKLAKYKNKMSETKGTRSIIRPSPFCCYFKINWSFLRKNHSI